MKKISKKGFTLIELLAVIVILAIIALIATPIIMNVINDAKKGSAKDSMYAYVKAVELATAKNMQPDVQLLSGTYTTTDGNLYNDSTKILDISSKGTKPENNSGTVTIVKGQVTNAELKFDGYDLEYNGNEVNNIAPQKKYIEGDIIYYNPETNKKCTVGEVNTTANAKTGCLKWNVITTGDTTSKQRVNIMLDHNTTSKVAWNSSGESADGMNEVVKALQADVILWNASVKSTVRLMSAKEIANILKSTCWPNCAVSLGYQSWLYQNLSSSNTTEKPIGYWTDTASLNYSNWAWYVNSGGGLNFSGSVANATSNGVRPVITIFKYLIA